MAIKKLDKVYCSLNIGYVYNLSYSFEPRQGVKISLFFVNESGSYDTSFLSKKQKVQIKIGNMSFNLLPVMYFYSEKFSDKTIKVDFIDDTYLLENYYLALTNRGCGTNVFTLGKTVDTRTDAEKAKENVNLMKIKEFTTFEDVQYSFSEFVDVLKKVFPVELKVAIDTSITRDFSGTFNQVLDSWCSYLGLSYFFENGVLKIFDLANLTINFPAKPADANDYTYSEGIENTYDRTAWNYFNAEGGELTIANGISTPLIDRSIILTSYDKGTSVSFPNFLSSEVSSIYADIRKINLLQCAATQYGQKFWFLYNVFKGSQGDECGWIEMNKNENILNTELAVGSKLNVGVLNEKIFSSKYEFYKKYGEEIAGRYYLSGIWPENAFDSYNLYVTNDQISTNMQNNVEWLAQYGRTTDLDQVKKSVQNIFGDIDYGVIPQTFINEHFNGVLTDGGRYVYRDEYIVDYTKYFSLDDDVAKEISGIYEQITDGLLGGKKLDQGYYDSGGNPISITMYSNVSFSVKLQNYFNNLSSKISLFSPRYNSITVKAIKQAEQTNQYNPYNTTQVSILSDQGGIVSNVSTIKTITNNSYVVYYSKYEKCQNSSSGGGGLKRQFIPRAISNDVPMIYGYTQKAGGLLEVTRDFSYFDKYSQSGIIDKIGKPFIQNRKAMSFSLNYFDPSFQSGSYLSSGLIGIEISFSSEGMTVTYNYSNEMLDVNFYESQVSQMEKNIKNSWIRQYNPDRYYRVIDYVSTK